MCGIFGFISYLPQERERLLWDVEQGIQRIRHRGPDGTGIWISQDMQVGFGHARLSIIDLESGDQPMSSDDGRFIIIYNGEIYNYIELRRELGEQQFHTRSDTEVILKAFQRWGMSCLDKLRGMFAFAIWDTVEKKLFLARDRFGIKPLYWTVTSEGFYFASEIKSLVPFLERREINNASLSDYFVFQFYLGDKTLMNNVHQLPAANYAWISPGQQNISPVRYWEVHYIIDYEHTETWFTDHLRELLYDSVRMHLRADVEVGSYVSGGLDSSILAMMAGEAGRKGQYKIFNGRFLDGLEFDESRYAGALAEMKDMQLYVTDISEQDFVDHLEKVIWHLDQPVAGPGAFPQYMVSRNVSNHLKVVLGGQGGDEIFGGYARYLIAYFEQCIKGAIEGTLHNGNYLVTYESIIPSLESLRQYKPLLKEFWSNGVFDERDERYWRLINRANSIGGILAPGVINKEDTYNEFQQIYWGNNVGKEAYLDSMTHFDFKTLLPALLQVEDRMSMAHGIEARVPFLDHPLVEFAATIPADIKFRNGELKRLLKSVFADKLPDKIRNRKDKMGFPVPLNLWLKQAGPAREFVADILGSDRARSRSYLGATYSIDSVLDGQSVYGRNIWALLSLELWQKQFIDTESSPVPDAAR